MEKARVQVSLAHPPDCDPQSASASAAIRSHLEKILASRTFRSAEAQRRFLRYAVEETLAGRGSQIKEYCIGTEAFGRGASFDPRLDPIVRTQARKLRARLDKYYQTEGVEDLWRIGFPKGSYASSFRLAETAEPTVDPAVTEPVIELATPFSTPHPLSVLRSGLLLAIAATVAAAAVLFYVRTGTSARSIAASRPSVAVMPLVNVGDDQAEFLSDGMTAELVDSLAQVPGLRVVARASTFHFKDKVFNVRDVGQQLNVSTVLEGSVKRFQNRLHVTVQLNNVADGYNLWSGSYERDTSDAHAIEKEIAQAVTKTLGLRFSPRENHWRGFPSLASPNPAAHRNYLMGLYFWNKLTPDGLGLAIQHFKQAIADDPLFARAYVALADSYVMMPQVAAAPSPAVVSKIREAAFKALELDPSLGDAHFDLAVCSEYEFDWQTADQEFKRGLQLSPGSALGHLWYAKYLALTGRRNEVLEQRRIAAELDPISPYAVQAVGGYFSVVGRYDDAIEQFRNALTLEPNFGLTHQGLGIAYLLKGRFAEAIEELQTANKLMRGPRRLALLGYAYAVAGRTSDARRVLSALLSQSERETMPALAIAQVYIGLGEKDQAFQWLQKAIDQKDLDLTLLWDSPYEVLRSDPRYLQLLHRMKLS